MKRGVAAAVIGFALFGGPAFGQEIRQPPEAGAQPVATLPVVRGPGTESGPVYPPPPALTAAPRPPRDASKEIRDMLASVTEAALRKDGVDDLVERLVEADRARVGAASGGGKSKELDAVVEQIRREWRSKYHQEFEIDEEAVFGGQSIGLRVVQGEKSRPALLSNVSLEGSTGSGPPRPMPAERTLEKAEEVAVVLFPADNGVPEVSVSLAHELPDHWRMDLPDSMDAARLRASLLRQLQAFAKAKDRWPADPHEGYRLAAHHVMAAVHGIEAKGDR